MIAECTQRVVYLPEQASYLVCDSSALFAYGQNDLPGRTTIAFPDTGLTTPCILPRSLMWSHYLRKALNSNDMISFTFDEWYPENGYHSHSKRPANQCSQP
jgi:hypothetical protein